MGEVVVSQVITGNKTLSGNKVLITQPGTAFEGHCFVEQPQRQRGNAAHGRQFGIPWCSVDMHLENIRTGKYGD